MGIFTSLKQVFSSTNKVDNSAEAMVYLLNANSNLKQAYDSLGKFLEGLKTFVPAKRHEQLYGESVYGKVNLLRAWVQRGSVFLDGKSGNSIGVVSSIKDTNHLINLIGDWCRGLKLEQMQNTNVPEIGKKNTIVYYSPDYKVEEKKDEEEKIPSDVYGILKHEMWAEKRVDRGFPVPSNKNLILENLDNAFNKLKEAKYNLEEYNMRNVSSVDV